MRVTQSGVALVLLVLSLLVSSGSLLLSRSLADKTAKAAALNVQSRTSRLLQARQTLLEYTVTYADNYLPAGAGPGHLPCPDRSPINDENEGNDGPDPPCIRPGSNLGRFPRFTYSRDQSNPEHAEKRIEFHSDKSLLDQQMWYVVSRSHINNPISTVVNPATGAELQVDSVKDVAAIIIEPGRDRSVHGSNRPGNAVHAYLEGENADLDHYYSQYQDADHNDLLVYITAAEINKLVRQRVALFVLQWLREYQHRNCSEAVTHCYPAAANEQGDCQSELETGYIPLYTGTCRDALTVFGMLDSIEASRHWFVRNGWLEFFRYQRDLDCLRDLLTDCTASVEWKQLSEDSSLEIGLIKIRPFTQRRETP